MSRHWISCLLPGLTILLVSVGCDDPVNLCEPQVSAGHIQGRVRAGGLPVNAEIEARRIVEVDEGRTTFTTETDEDGFYDLALTPGRYTVRLYLDRRQAAYDYTASGLGCGNISPDTVLVDGSNSQDRIDFDLGGMTLRLDLSDNLDGERGKVVLHLREETEAGGYWTYLSGGRTEFAAGRLEMDLAGIFPGEYKVEIRLDSGETFWMPGTHDPDEAPWYEVAADSLVTLESDIASTPARFEGRISGAWVEMGLNTSPDISLVNLDSIPVIKPFRTGDDGSFAIDVYLPGSVKVEVTQWGISQWVGGPDFDEATVYDLQAGQTITGVDLIQSGIHFFIEPYEENPGSAEIKLYDPVSLEPLSGSSSLSIASRHVAIPNLWPGEFLILVTPTPWMMGNAKWRPQWFDRESVANQARTITITTAGEVVGLDLILETGGVISGMVENEDGSMPFYQIVITPADEFSPWARRQILGLTGEYSMVGLPDGDFKVGILPPFYHEGDIPDTGVTWYPGTSDWETAGVVEIRDASVVTGVDFFIPKLPVIPR